ncbi:MAG: hypothetical protein IJX68_00260 [Rikenellaceae bacterium]|nr:hypothetical protein [Rikenellaceae bacterium]
MKHFLTLVLLAMQIAVCAAQPTAPLTNPTAESKVLYIVADSCEFYISSAFFISKKYKDNATYYTLNIPTKDGTFAIGCKEMFLVENGKGYWPIDRVFSKSDLDKTPTIRMKDFAKGKSAKQLQRAYDRWQEEYDYVFVTKCHNPDNDKQERILAVDSYIHKPSKVKYPHYPIDSLTNAVKRGVGIVVIDSNKPYAKRVVRDTAYISYAYGMYAQIFNYEFVDHNGEKSLNNFMQTQENLYPLDEANVFTIDRKQFKWDSDVALDLSELASKRDIKDVWSIIYTFNKGHILYFIDRAEITKNTITVRTCNTLLFTTGGFGGIRKKSTNTK